MEENLMKETIKGICHALVTYHVSHDKFVWIVKPLPRIHNMYTNYLLYSFQLYVDVAKNNQETRFCILSETLCWNFMAFPILKIVNAAKLTCVDIIKNRNCFLSS